MKKTNKLNFFCNFFIGLFCLNFLFLTKSVHPELNTLLDANNTEKESFDLNEDSYILGPGDQLSIVVPDLNKLNLFPEVPIQILNDGTISFIYADKVKIAGMTIAEAREHLINVLSKELIAPQIEMFLVYQRKVTVSVLGEVNSPGLHSEKMRIDTAYDPITLVDAIDLAGGVTPEANLSKISLMRKLPDSNESNYKIAEFNLVDLIKKGDLSQNPYMFDGDIVKIEKSSQTYDLDLMKSTLTPEVINVFVVGEVLNPGSFQVKSNTPINKVILAAGGLKQNRAKKNISLIRLRDNGSLLTKYIDTDFSKKANRKDNPLLKDGDIIKINKNLLANTSDAVDVITKPLTGIANTIYLIKLIND